MKSNQQPPPTDALRARILDHLELVQTFVPPSGHMLRYLVDMAVQEAREADYLRGKGNIER